MKEDFVTNDMAVKLMEKGFSLEKSNLQDGNILLYNLLHVENVNFQNEAYRLPTIAQVLKWLREEKKIHIAVNIWSGYWSYDIIELVGKHSVYWGGITDFVKYEQAALAGIEHVFDNFIV